MRLVEALAYAPIVSSSLSTDGRWVAAVVPRYDALAETKFQALAVRDLDGEGGWRLVGEPGDSFHAATISPCSRHLAVFRRHDTVADLAVFDLQDLDAEPVVPVGMPPGAVAMAWQPGPSRLSCLGVDDANCRRVWRWHTLDAPPEPITPPGLRVGDHAFHPDGEGLAWLHIPPRVIGRPEPVSTLWVTPTAGEPGVAVAVPEPWLGFLTWSPDGTWLAGLARPSDDLLTHPRLWVVCPDTGETRRLFEGHEGWITGMDWLSDGSGLLIAVDQGICGRLYRVGLDGTVVSVGPRDACLSGPRVASGTGRTLWLHQDGHLPQHLRIAEPTDPPEAEGRRISRFNPRLSALSLHREERFTWTGADGLELEGLWMAPAGDPPFGTIVWLHGGPAEHLHRTFSAYFQIFAAAGFAVFAPNYRGSTGRTDAFLQASVGDLCGADADDVSRGVRRLIQTGRAHRRRCGVVGWSYGGALALAVGAAQPWVRAIVAGCPVVDWLTVFGARTWPHVTRAYFPGDPWEVPEAYDAASPLRRLKDVRAPTLLLHGAEDERVPLAQSRLVERILAARGTPAQLRVFPDEGHVFASPWAVREMLSRTLGWMSAHLVVDDEA